MIEFFTRIFKRETSGTTAKERLRLVLLSDHLALAPDVVAAMKADLLEVISRYVDIDPAHSDVTFEQQDRTIAMLANVPILGLKAREHPGARVAPPFAVPQLASVAAAQAGAHDAGAAVLELRESAGGPTAPEPHRDSGPGPSVSEAVTVLDELRAAEAPPGAAAHPSAERASTSAPTPMLPLEPTAAADSRIADSADVAGDRNAHDASAATDASTAHTAAQPGAAPVAAAAAGKSAPKAAGAKPRARRRRRRAAAKPSPAAG